MIICNLDSKILNTTVRFNFLKIILFHLNDPLGSPYILIPNSTKIYNLQSIYLIIWLLSYMNSIKINKVLSHSEASWVHSWFLNKRVIYIRIMGTSMFTYQLIVFDNKTRFHSILSHHTNRKILDIVCLVSYLHR